MLFFIWIAQVDGGMCRTVPYGRDKHIGIESAGRVPRALGDELQQAPRPGAV